MEDLSFKKIVGFLFKLFILYLAAYMVAFTFGKGLYIVTSVDLYPYLSILHKIFFVILCVATLFQKRIAAWFRNLAHRDLAGQNLGKRSVVWQKALFFLATVAFLHIRLAQAVLAFANYYVNRDKVVVTHNYTSLNRLGTLEVLAVSMVLAVLLLLLLSKCRPIQSIAPILALICGALAILALLGLPGGEGLTEDMVVNHFSPISLPDTGVLAWALPALVLSHYGDRADSFQKQNYWAKIMGYGSIALSCTFVGDLLGLIGRFRP